MTVGPNRSDGLRSPSCVHLGPDGSALYYGVPHRIRLYGAGNTRPSGIMRGKHSACRLRQPIESVPQKVQEYIQAHTE